LAELAVAEVVLQRETHRAERQCLPRDLLFGEQPHLQTLDSGREFEIQQFGPEQQVYLADVGQVVQVYSSPMRTRALASSSVSRAAASAVVSPFSMNPAGSVHKPWRGSMARRQSSTCPAIPGGRRRSAWILVVDFAAGGADMAVAVVIGWLAQLDR